MRRRSYAIHGPAILGSLTPALIVLVLCLVPSCKKAPSGEGNQAPKAPASNAAVKGGNEVKAPVAPGASTEAKTPAETGTAVAAGNVEMVPIDIKLPRPMFEGTPQDAKVANLEKPLGKPRAAFLAPKGTVNLALHKPVKSSDEMPIIGSIELITDGDKEAADGSYVELGPQKQYVTIDLQQEAEIYAIVVWHYHKQSCVYFDVVVQVSEDPDFIKLVKTVFNNDTDNSSGLGIGKDMHYTETAEGKLIDSKGVRGRYVRLYSNGNNLNEMNHYIEVEVYGRPVP